jgi:energy-coupling factor transporter transmembrane protein EcfT
MIKKQELEQPVIFSIKRVIGPCVLVWIILPITIYFLGSKYPSSENSYPFRALGPAYVTRYITGLLHGILIIGQIFVGVVFLSAVFYENSKVRFFLDKAIRFFKRRGKF